MKIHPSALKHGIDEADILHAVQQAAFESLPDDEVPAKRFVLGFDRHGRLLELVLIAFDSGNELVIHAMKARRHFHDLLDQRRFAVAVRAQPHIHRFRGPEAIGRSTGGGRGTPTHAAVRRLQHTPVASQLGLVLGGPIIAPSALKHGIDEADILHAQRNPVRIWDLGDGFTMMVGPSGTAIFIEIGYVEGDQAHVIVHAMRAREKFLR